MPPKKGASKKQILPVPDSDHIVFGDDKKKKNSKKPAAPQDGAGPSEPLKPTARQVVGGASWTGKLPVNLLSEFCQRQKWNKPDYSMRQMPAKDGGERLYRSDVVLSKTDPKTRETTKLPSIRLPPSEAHLADQPSALEARHFAATYALFRVQSMKSIHMTLPPSYRDFWKGDFTRLKKEDIDAGHAWKYDEDPFAAEAKRQEIHKAMEKRKEEEKKRQDAQVDRQGEVTMTGQSLPHRENFESKTWERAPQVVMGQQIRIDVEEIVRQRAVWNQHRVNLSKQQRSEIAASVTRLGFRKSHVEEALESCKDQEEVLEWLLIHVPEDDLPRWTFPSNYNAGVSLASGDIAKEGKLKRLALAGYPPDLCARVLRDSQGDESLAAFTLQGMLVPVPILHNNEQLESSSAWEEEVNTLDAIFGENFKILGDSQCSITMSTTSGQAFTAIFRCPKVGYPQTTVPVLSIDIHTVPAYVRLSAIKNAIQYAQSELLGEVMLYSICQWLEAELPVIIENPGKLTEVHFNSRTASTAISDASRGKGKDVARAEGRPFANRAQRKDKRTDSEFFAQWKLRQETLEQIKMVDARKRLPAWTKQERIIAAIQDHQVTIISGETGSGKSTQVVQFVLDHAIQSSQGSRTNILCTQPRRVAALSLADRVGSERCSQVGGEVGYIIRGESKVSESTKITFMTTGVLLRKLQSSSTMKAALSNVSHVFIDEVHERSLDTDFLLALLKECLAHSHIKVILMSATLDAAIFSDYFGGHKKVALVNIQGRTYPVQDIYLEDVIALRDPAMAHDDVGKAIQSLGFGINYELIRDMVLHIDKELGNEQGSILIFLPGTMEIERCLRMIATEPKILGLPLHASLLPSEQRKVFPVAPAGRRKVVAATNVAETSITIEDIVAVIDTGKVKETRYDVVNNFVRLEEVWASQAACKQRRGRAGRVRAGICYKLFTTNTESKMSVKTLPEIQRVPLEQLCLSVKATGAERDVAKFLSQTLTPPDSGAVSNAIRALHNMNALEDDKLTALGVYLAMVPADLRCAKLLVYGTLFDCLEPCLTIASVLTVKSPFMSPREKREAANEARMSFPSQDGDLLLDMRAYDEWSNLSQTMRHTQLNNWCLDHFIAQQTMRDIASTRRQILDSLKDAGLVPLEYRSPTNKESLNNNHEQTVLLTALIAASLQPQLALISFPSKKYIASISGAKELDPEARTIKFFIPEENAADASKDVTPISSRPSTPKPKVPESSTVVGSSEQKGKMPPLSRVFIHPASCLFSAQTFPRHSTHLSYFTRMMTTKPFVRDLTPLNIYSLLLFGGKLELNTSGHGLTVGGAWRVRGWARIGVLVSRLRVLLDEELQKTIEGGGVLLGSMKDSQVVHLVRRLLILDGQDQ